MQMSNPHHLDYKAPGSFEETRYEKLHNVICENPNQGSKLIAQCIANLIKDKQENNETCVLGLATGSSPISVYRELVRLHREEGLSFQNVVSFNLDEYYPLSKEDVQSYHYFMHTHLFNHVDIKPEQVHIPRGEVEVGKVREFCIEYENKIKEAGGIDLQILGIGRTGHIGFNEPGSHQNSKTRTITLDHLTRYDAAPSFQGIENVPRKAITMGIQTILSAKRILLMAWGTNKSEIIQKAIEGSISPMIPTTYLQLHKNTTLVLDHGAASELTRIKTPWLVSQCEWDEILRSKAITWLCEQTKKSILKLIDEDYNKHGMSDLLALHGSAYDLNINMFNKLQRSITGWPGGKPNADDTYRAERALPEKKRVIIFSPHPDDDVISMGGTFDRLVEQGHEVHIAYQTSGNIAVSDQDAKRFLEVTKDLLQSDQNQHTLSLEEEFEKINPQEPTPQGIRNLKGSIRKRESLGATRYIGIPDEQVHFMNLPFYETGLIDKNPVSQKDLDLTIALIEELKPHQIYAAGDLADPHGTHRVCLDLIFEALETLKTKPYMKDCWMWLYRGAWHEWEIHEIEMAVPMSPDQVLKKRKAIFFHQSQKDGVMFQGEDNREFWIRVEDRNTATAKKYKEFGLSEYAAIEAFKRHHFL
ncbi:MAG: glucosamine-6-phosphate deaminase [Flavobacteriaceae bacterium]|nr:glucosamine-6-phosphate deaminase [Flavobacteriaceae bacterium]